MGRVAQGQVLSETGAPGQRYDAHRDRGRWSAPGAPQSVDLDTLLEAPSPPSSRRPRRTCVSGRFRTLAVAFARL